MLKTSNTGTVTVKLCTENRMLCDIKDHLIKAWRGRQDQKAGKKYVSLVNTTHTENSAIPLRRFVLLPNTGWENQVTWWLRTGTVYQR